MYNSVKKEDVERRLNEFQGLKELWLRAIFALFPVYGSSFCLCGNK